MFKLLRQPFPFEKDFLKKLPVIFFSSLFVFTFLFLFKPFGLAELPSTLLLSETFKYGLLTAIVLAVVNFVLPLAFPAIFKEETWTVLKDILFGAFAIVLIGLANFLYVTHQYSSAITFYNAAYFVGITFLVGIFPVTFFILRKQIRLNNKYESEALGLSNQMIISNSITLSESKKINSTDSLLSLKAENGKENFQFEASSVLFIASAGNYIEVYESTQNKIKKTLIRCSLKAAAGQLSKAPDFIRCHRMFIVNRGNVTSVSGNSQGFRLHFQNLPDSVPVSRNLDKEIFKRFLLLQK